VDVNTKLVKHQDRTPLTDMLNKRFFNMITMLLERPDVHLCKWMAVTYRTSEYECPALEVVVRLNRLELVKTILIRLEQAAHGHQERECLYRANEEDAALGEAVAAGHDDLAWFLITRPGAVRGVRAVRSAWDKNDFLLVGVLSHLGWPDNESYCLEGDREAERMGLPWYQRLMRKIGYERLEEYIKTKGLPERSQVRHSAVGLPPAGALACTHSLSRLQRGPSLPLTRSLGRARGWTASGERRPSSAQSRSVTRRRSSNCSRRDWTSPI
jgi:hypothetical protein